MCVFFPRYNRIQVGMRASLPNQSAVGQGLHDNAAYSIFTIKTHLALCLLILVFVCTVSLFAPATGARAACPVPNQITNGQLADATVVMGNFNTLANCSTATTGSPVAGDIANFSGPSSITGGNLSGDCTTTGSLTVTCTKSNGIAFSYFATGTDAGQLTGTISVNRFNNGNSADGAHFLRGDGVWAIPPGGTDGGTATSPVVRASTIQSSIANSFTVSWPPGTVQGDVVIIFGECGWGFANPAGWTVFDNQTGGNAQGIVVAKIMTAADIAAGSVTITQLGTYNGVIAAVTINGSTMSGVHPPGQFVKSNSGPAAGASIGLSSFTPISTDLILVFVGVRGATNLTFSSGLIPLTSINAANASGAVGKLTGPLTSLGVNENATSSSAGSGYYTAVVVLR